MSTPEPRSAFGAALAPRRHGAAAGEPVLLRERRLDCVIVAARRGREPDLAAGLRAALSLDLPEAGRAVTGASASVLWIAPETWLVTAPPEPPGELAARLGRALGSAAAVIDQSFGLAALRLSGARARAVLAKGCRIDLHPREFGPGRVARTIIAQVPAILHQADDAPSFGLLVPSTLAVSFAEFLLHAAAEFGCDIADPD